MIFYTSDLHFGHKKVIEYDARPFADIVEMDEELIRRWNEKVSEEDTVYVLGDISWYKANKTWEIFKRLKGNIVLIRGNHDSDKMIEGFKEVYDYKEIEDGDIRVVLCHYPIMFYNGRHRGHVMLHGHVHNSVENEITKEFRDRIEEKCKIFNVGCMLWNYEPVTLEEILAKERMD